MTTHYPTLTDLMEVDPPIVLPDIPVLQALTAMYHRKHPATLQCTPYGPNYPSAPEYSSYLLIYPISDPNLTSGPQLGIFTERDLVRLTAMGLNLGELTMGEVMTRPVITLKAQDSQDLFTILSLFRHYQIRHLPVIDDQQELIGVITLDHLRQQLQPINLLKFRLVTEVMTHPVIQAEPHTSILEISQLMLNHKTSCVLITETRSVSPQGIITERDIIQFQILGLDLAKTMAGDVMSRPVFQINLQDNLLKAYQGMQQRRVRHLAVTDPRGKLQGILTQTNLLSILNSVEIYDLTTLLQEQITQLENDKINLLTAQNQLLQNQAQSCNSALQNQVLSLNLLLTLQQRIRQSLDLNEILTTTVTEVQTLLNCDQVLIYRFTPNWSGVIVAESRANPAESRIGNLIDQCCFNSIQIEHYHQGKIETIQSIYDQKFAEVQIQELEELDIKSMIVIPIVQLNLPVRKTPNLWGLLIVAQERQSHVWLSSEVELLEKIATPLSIAIQQSELYQQSQIELRERQWAESEIRNLNNQLKDTNSILRAEIHHHRLTEAALEKERNFVSAVLSVAGALVIVLDQQGRVVRFNQTCEQITGYQYEEMAGRCIWDVLLLPEERDTVARVFVQLTAGNFPNQHENYWVSKTGRRYLIAWSNTAITNAQGQVEYVIATGIDITERKQAEQALQASEEKFRQLAENIREVFFIQDAQSFEIIYISPVFEQIWGYDCEEVYQNAYIWLDSVYPQDRDSVIRAIQFAIAGNNFSVEYRIITAGAGTRWIRARGSPVRNAQNQIYRIVGVAEDITDRKQTAAALQASEERYATLAAVAPVGIFRTNLAGKCLYANEQAYKIVGIPLHSAFEVGWLHHLHPEDRDRVCENLAEALRERVAFRAEYRFQHPDQTVVWVLEQYEPEQTAWGEVTSYVATLTDITQRKQDELALQQLNEKLEAKVEERTAQLVELTQTLQREINERKQAEISLKTSEERFRIIFEQVAVGIILLNPAGEFLKFNQKFCDILGYSPEQLAAHTIFTLTAPDDMERYQTYLEKLWMGKLTTYALEKRYLHQRGTVVWTHVTVSLVRQPSGEPDYLIAVVEDISERKQSEAIQADLMRRNESIVRALGEIVYDHIVSTNTIIWDGEYTQVLGYSPSEIGENSQSWLSRVHPDDLTAVNQEFERASQTDHLYDLEYRFQLKDGSYRWFHDRGVIHTQGNEPEQIIGVLRDVTQRKQVEEELRKSLAKEKELNELKSRFISMTSHEFRTPLTAILGAAELLKHCSDNWHQSKKDVYLDRIRQNVERMTEMLDDILTLGKADAGYWKLNPAPLNLIEFCQELIAEFQSGFGKNHDLVFIHPETEFGNIQLNFDEIILRKILGNLLSNAMKYSPPQTEISLALRIDSNTIIFEVQDAGMGIPPEEQVHLFESFYRARNVGNIQGTGLGLAIVKKAVDLYGGTITVQSEPGAGTRFTVKLDLK